MNSSQNSLLHDCSWWAQIQQTSRSLGKDVISWVSSCEFVSATREINQATLLSITLVLTRMTVSRAHEPAETAGETYSLPKPSRPGPPSHWLLGWSYPCANLQWWSEHMASVKWAIGFTWSADRRLSLCSLKHTTRLSPLLPQQPQVLTIKNILK